MSEKARQVISRFAEEKHLDFEDELDFLEIAELYHRVSSREEQAEKEKLTQGIV